MNVQKIYFSMPVILQNLLINIQGYRLYKKRFGKVNNKVFESYMQSDPAKVDLIALREFLLNANNSPYWRKKFNEYNINLVGDFCPTKEISKLPVLTKHEVKENWNDIAIANMPNTSKTVTSGSTGSALTILQTRDSIMHQWAVWERDRRTHGVGVNTWMGWFGGKPIVPIKQKKPPYWRTCYPLKQIMFSISHLNHETVVDYFNKVRSSKLTWLHGYPSQLALFAALIKKYNLGKLPNIKLISTGSESLMPHQKSLMEEVFEAKVVECYGLAEGVSAITQDEQGTFFSNQDFAFTEFFLLEKGVESNKFKIVGTNYRNLSFPLIRYFTGDIATIENNEIIAIDGRLDDYILLPNGVRVGRLYHIFQGTQNILEAQIYQPNINEIVIRIVRSDSFSDGDEKIIIKDARERFGDAIDIKIEYLDLITKTKSGKLRLVISDVKDSLF